MQKKQNKNGKIPHPLAFYIKLYVKRKNLLKSKCHNNLVEATKSWLSLNESEKQQFESKYKEYKQKCLQKYFDLLKNAEPFMKARDIRLENEFNESNVDDNLLESFSENVQALAATEPAPGLLDINKEQNNEPQENYLTNESKLEEHEIESSVNLDVEPIDTNVTHIDVPQPVLLEPVQLTLKTGRELFLLLNTANETKDWASLPQVEKNQYNRAVLLLKKDYITKYRTYLESLSDKELYEHYNKNY